MELAFNCIQQRSTFCRTNQYKRYALIVIECCVILFYMPEVCEGDISRSIQISKMAIMTGWTQHNVFVEQIGIVTVDNFFAVFQYKGLVMCVPTKAFIAEICR